MKKIITLFLAAFCINAAIAQSNLGVGTATPDASAKLDVSATDKGMLVPRMTKAQRDAIATPATSLMIYQTDNTPGFYYNSGTPAAKNWVMVGSSSTGTTLELIADKTGGTGEIIPLNGTTTPVTIVFNNAVTSPTIGSYSTTTGEYTVGTTGAGVYMIQARLRGPDYSTPANTVPYSLIIQVNGASYGSSSNVYGPYPALSTQVPVGLKARGEIMAYIKLAAGDKIKIQAISANGGVASPSPNTDASCNLMVMKMN